MCSCDVGHIYTGVCKLFRLLRVVMYVTLRVCCDVSRGAGAGVACVILTHQQLARLRTQLQRTHAHTPTPRPAHPRTHPRPLTHRHARLYAQHAPIHPRPPTHPRTPRAYNAHTLENITPTPMRHCTIKGAKTYLYQDKQSQLDIHNAMLYHDLPDGKNNPA